jgi:hypothetical protein
VICAHITDWTEYLVLHSRTTGIKFPGKHEKNKLAKPRRLPFFFFGETLDSRLGGNLMTTKETCSICDGSGSVKQPSGKETPCQNCAGTGIIVTTNAPVEEERQWPKK